MVYAASSLALAILEYYVHLPPQMRLRSALPELVAIALDVPNDAIETLSVPDLANLTLQDTRDIGDDWIRSRRSLGLLVPSRAVPYDLNLLVNPAHPRLGQALIAIQTPFLFDDRLAI